MSGGIRDQEIAGAAAGRRFCFVQVERVVWGAMFMNERSPGALKRVEHFGGVEHPRSVCVCVAIR